MNRKKVKVILLSFMLFSFVAYSQPPPPPPGLPIDGGLSWLLISGMAYGIYTLKRKKQ